MKVELEEFDDEKGNTFDTCIVRVEGKQVGYLGKPSGCVLNFLPGCGLSKKEREEVIKQASEIKKELVPGWVEPPKMEDADMKLNPIDE